MIFNSSISANPQAFLQQLMGQSAAGNGGNIGSWGFSPLGLMPWSSYAPSGQAAQQTLMTNYQPLSAPSGTAAYNAPQTQSNPLQQYGMVGFRGIPHNGSPLFINSLS